MYAFSVHDAHQRLLVDGRASVVFDAPLGARPAERVR
jgi:hypothetical protein